MKKRVKSNEKRVTRLSKKQNKNTGQAAVETLFAIMMLLGLIWGIMQIALLGTGQMALLLGAQQSARSNVVRKNINTGYFSIMPHGSLWVRFQNTDPNTVRVHGVQRYILNAIPFFGRHPWPSLTTGGVELQLPGLQVEASVEMAQTWEGGVDFYHYTWPGAPRD